MHIEFLCEFCDGEFTLKGDHGHLGFECRRVIPARSSAHESALIWHLRCLN